MDVMQEEAGFGSTGFDGPQITGLFNFQSFFFLTVGILILYDLFQERCTKCWRFGAKGTSTGEFEGGRRYSEA